MPKESIIIVSLAQRRRSRSARACAACAPRGDPSREKKHPKTLMNPKLAPTRHCQILHPSMPE